MKLVTIALGAGIGIGYLAANEDARNKVWASLMQAKESTQAKSIEDKVGGAVSGVVSQLADKRRSTGDDMPPTPSTISPETPSTSVRSVLGC